MPSASLHPSLRPIYDALRLVWPPTPPTQPPPEIHLADAAAERADEAKAVSPAAVRKGCLHGDAALTQD